MVATDSKLLVLGLGSTLLRDDGIGLLLLRTLEARAELHWQDRVEFVRGGAEALALLPELGLADRAALVVLDTVTLGAKAGTVHVLTRGELGRLHTASRESHAGELLTAAVLGGECPESVFVIGVEPDAVRTGLGVSDSVAKVLHRAVDRAAEVIEHLLSTAELWVDRPEARPTSPERFRRTSRVG